MPQLLLSATKFHPSLFLTGFVEAQHGLEGVAAPGIGHRPIDLTARPDFQVVRKHILISLEKPISLLRSKYPRPAKALKTSKKFATVHFGR